MPLLIALGLILAAVLFGIVAMPFALIVRYRAGTRRRRARRWIASINVVSLALSTLIFAISATVASAWVPNALSYSAVGFGSGLALGLGGLLVTRWEREGAELHYTPSRLLMLLVSLVVAARIAYSFWRGWRVLQSSPDASWVAAFGIAGSMGAGALVLGYSLMYSFGVFVRVRR